MILFPKFRRRWRLAKVMAEAEADGEALIRVPGHLAAQLKTYAWQLYVETGAEKWAAQGREIPLSEWQAAMTEAGRHRLSRPRGKR